MSEPELNPTPTELVRNTRKARGAAVILWLDRLLTIEAISALYALGWGITFINPSYDTFEGSSTYQAMAAWFHEEVWAIWFGILGLLTLIAIARPNRRVMYTVLSLLASTWAFVTVMIFRANPASPGVWTYGILALLTLGVAVRRYGQSIG